MDDLRIFKAYYLAAQNNMGDYSKQLASVSESIYKLTVMASIYMTFMMIEVSKKQICFAFLFGYEQYRYAESI